MDAHPVKDFHALEEVFNQMPGGQVAPNRFRVEHQQSGIEKRPMRPAGATLAKRHEWLDTLPLRIGENVACIGRCRLIG